MQGESWSRWEIRWRLRKVERFLYEDEERRRRTPLWSKSIGESA